MERIIMFMGCMLFSGQAISQTPTFEWAKPLKTVVYSLVTDKDDNVYTMGFFSGTVDFNDDDTGKYIVTANLTDVYVIKSDHSGKFIWARTIGGADYDYGNSVATDSAGNVYLAGYFKGTCDFDPGVNKSNLTSFGGSDFFIMKLDASGNFKWAKNFGNSSDESVISITADLGGNVFATGSYKGFIDFNPGAKVYNLASSGSDDIYVLKLYNDGEFGWAKSAGESNNTDVAYGIATNIQGDLCISGTFYETMNCDPGITDFEIQAHGSNRDAFIIQYDVWGSFKWAGAFGGTANESCPGVALDQKGNMFITGYFASTSDFDPGTGTFNLTLKGFQDAYIAKINPGGTLAWAKQFGGNKYLAEGKGLTTDISGNVYTTGPFGGTIDFDPDNSATYNLTSAGDNDFYIAMLNTEGALSWAQEYGSKAYEESFKIICNEKGYLYTQAGIFNLDSLDVDAGPGKFMIKGSTYFLQKMSLCPKHAVPVNMTSFANGLICYNTITKLSVKGNGRLQWYNLMRGGTLLDTGSSHFTPALTSNATYYLQDSTCPASVVRLRINVMVKPAILRSTSLVNNSTIIASETGATYRWMECAPKKLLSDTGRSFTSTKSGRYAVIITKNGCTDTSDCTEIKLSNSLFRLAGTNTISVYPNPNNGEFAIITSQSGTYRIINELGQCLQILKLTPENNYNFSISGLGKGIYFITGVNNNLVIREKIVVAE